MSSCTVCGGSLLILGELRLCRSCSESFVVRPNDPPGSYGLLLDRPAVVRMVIEAWDRLTTTARSDDGLGGGEVA